MKIDPKNVQRLDQITIKLERVKTPNPIIEDMRWLASQLRAAYILLEGKNKS